MKYLKSFNETSSNIEIDSICKKYGIESYTVNEDGSIDVDGNVNLNAKFLKKLPLKFNKVTGDFYCAHNYLTSLEGAPQYVGGSFNCSANELISLKHCPKHVGGDFNCVDNFITSLDSYPEYVGKFFTCSGNPIDYIYRNFIKTIDNIELFNEFRIIIGKKLYLNRLNDYLKANGLSLHVIYVPHYKIIK